MRIGREVDAEEEHDQQAADRAKDGNRNRGRAARDAPGAELPEELGEVDVLEQVPLIGRDRDLLAEIGDAARDALAKLSNLGGDGRARSGNDRGDNGRDQSHDRRERGKARQPRRPRNDAARTIKHDGQQNAGKTEKYGGPRKPQRGSDGENDDRTGRGPHRRVKHRPPRSLRLADDGLVKAAHAVGHGRFDVAALASPRGRAKAASSPNPRKAVIA